MGKGGDCGRRGRLVKSRLVQLARINRDVTEEDRRGELVHGPRRCIFGRRIFSRPVLDIARNDNESARTT